MSKTKIFSPEEVKRIIYLHDHDHMNFTNIGKIFGKYRATVRDAYNEGMDNPETSGTEGSSFTQGDNFTNIICSSRRVLTIEELLFQFNVSLDDWKVESFQVKTSEGYRKDKQTDWVVTDGHVEGEVHDSGMMLVVPLYHITAKLKRRTEEIRFRNVLKELIEEMKTWAPTYPPLTRKTYKKEDGMCYEIGMPDIHYGRLTWKEESGEDYDIKIADSVVSGVLDDLLNRVTGFPVSQILLPIGNDFFNVDNKEDKTAGGTPQQEDTRWQKTFRNGLRLAIKMIDKCTSVAPVKVILVYGNHDPSRSFYMGEALACWYHGSKEVTIDNRAVNRKYFSFGNTLLGFAHGSDEKQGALPAIMPLEAKELWAQSKYREWHIGHKHHTSLMVQEVNEEYGVVVRILRSLVPVDAWTFNTGFVGAVRAAESFLWHPVDGLIAQFTAIPKT